MKIVHVITRFIRGGADENTLLTCNGQAGIGHEVHLVFGDHHPKMVEQLDARIRVHHLASLVRQPSPRDVACLFQLTSLFRRLRPDIVHTHESKAGILGRLAARMARVPLVVHGVHILPFLNVSKPVAFTYLFLEKVAANFTHAYVNVSAQMQELCIAQRLGTPEIHYTVPSGMDISMYRNAEPINRDTLVPGHAISATDVIVIMAGHLERRKRIGDLIEALGSHANEGGWTLLIAGEGPEQANLEAQISRLGLDHRVLLLGFRDDLPRLFASADIFVHAADNEGLPRVVVQAVLAGKPVVAPALPGIERVVRDGRNGLLADLDSIDQLGRSMIKVTADSALRRRLSAGGREVDLSQWESGAMVDGIELVYSDARARLGLVA